MSSVAKDILSLSVSERILLVKDIRDSIAEVLCSVAQTEELELRLDAYHRNPDAGSPWVTVRERIRIRV